MPASPRCRAPLLASLLASTLLTTACGGGGGLTSPEPFVVTAPPPGLLGPGLPIAPPLPATPPRAPTWNPDAVSLGRTAFFGSFPSDLERLGDTLFVVDADQIEAAGARVLVFDANGEVPVPSPQHAETRIRVQDLVDSAGAQASFAAPIGFGFYLNDLEVVDHGLAFVLVNAGGSDSAPALSNLVAFDPTTGLVRQVVNLAQPFASTQPLVDSAGGVAAGGSFLQAGAEALVYVPTPAGGRLFVAMTNLLVGPPSFGSHRQRGTVQVFDVLPGAPAPVVPRPVPGLATETWLTVSYNPVALAALETDQALPDGSTSRLLVIAGGVSLFGANNAIAAVTEADVEVFDALSSQYRGRFALGLAGLAGTPPALGRDAAGHRVGCFASSVTGEVYLLRLDGLYGAQVEPQALAVLRGVGNGLPVVPWLAGTPGGNLSGIALSPDARTLWVTSFGDLFAFPSPFPGQLRALALPPDLLGMPGFQATYVPGTTLYAAEVGRTLGGLLLRPNVADFPDVFVLVGGAIDPVTFLGAGPASVGTLSTFGVVR